MRDPAVAIRVLTALSPVASLGKRQLFTFVGVPMLYCVGSLWLLARNIIPGGGGARLPTELHIFSGLAHDSGKPPCRQ